MPVEAVQPQEDALRHRLCHRLLVESGEGVATHGDGKIPVREAASAPRRAGGGVADRIQAQGGGLAQSRDQDPLHGRFPQRMHRDDLVTLAG